MIYFFVSLLFVLPLCAHEPKEGLTPSSPEEIASLLNPTDFLIGGVVSPSSGFPVLSATDLIAPGVEPIVVRRVYTSPAIPCQFDKDKEADQFHLCHHLQSTYKGWQYYPHIRLSIRSNELFLADSNGMTLAFKWPIKGKPQLSAPPYGLSNYTGDLPSAQYDPRNIHITSENNHTRIIIRFPNGTTRIYHHTSLSDYLLHKEILPNGKVLRYHYEHFALRKIESLDPHEHFIYATLQIKGSPFTGEYSFHAGTQTIQALYEQKQATGQFKRDKGKTTYSIPYPPLLKQIKHSDIADEMFHYCNRFLLCNIDSLHQTFKLRHAQMSGKNGRYQVVDLSMPTGDQGSFQSVYALSYHPPIPGKTPGHTTAKQPGGAHQTYEFSKELLLTAIIHKDANDRLIKRTNYTWNKHQHIQSITLCDANKQPLYTTVYQCDDAGNPLLETRTGATPNDTFTLRRHFSPQHLLLCEEEVNNDRLTTYTYLPGTHLITSKLLSHHGVICQREFHRYDEYNNLIQTLIDDGTTPDLDDLSGVTQRTFTTYLLRQIPPFLHMPEWIIESYLENHTERLLRKKHLTYDQNGHIVEEAIYDANHHHAYTLYRTYNEQGKCLTETNPLGQTTIHTYDTKGHRLSTQDSSGHHQLYTYDKKGRRITTTHQGHDGQVHTSQTSYDRFDRPTQSLDSFGNPTLYEYEPFQIAPTRTHFPPLIHTSVTTSTTYDALNRPVTKTDANGQTTTYRYNAYGLPLEIHYPDGTQETYLYSPDGYLLSHTDPNGLILRYKRDLFGRILTQTYATPTADLAQETFTYSTFHLLHSTDREGHTRTYTYDGAGRKIRESFAGTTTAWSYNPLGHLQTLIQYNGDNTLTTHYTRDLIGRLLKEQKMDASGVILYQIEYTYDAACNLTSITRDVDRQRATESWCYDSLNRLTTHTDAEGNLTSTTYDEHHRNALGQRVLTTSTFRPDHSCTIKVDDALYRPSTETTYAPNGSITSYREFTHDPHGNLLTRRDDNHLLAYTYTPTHRVASYTRAFGTPYARTTTFAYSPSLITKTLPSGLTLYYRYHPLGFLSEILSSDGTLHHRFEYNRNGHLQAAFDDKIAIYRQTDPFGSVTQEKFPTATLYKTYDYFQRPLTLQTEACTLTYTYDPLHLQTVSRFNLEGHCLYTHTYTAHDTSGHSVSEELIGNLGTAYTQYSRRGQITAIDSPFFSEHCTYSPTGNLLTRTSNPIAYTYDSNDQLTAEPHRTYQYDPLHNRIACNNEPFILNPLNELLFGSQIHCEYDLNGNPILRHSPTKTTSLTYDALDRLIEVKSPRHHVFLTYDPLGRCLNKKNGDIEEHYLYDGMQEIGALNTQGELLNLKVLGENAKPVAIELLGKVLAPILDVQGNVRRLIDSLTAQVVERLDFTAFGEPLTPRSPLTPWGFASKRYHPDLQLIDFGKRYYDPLLGRWLTTDPAGFVDSINLYQYVWNNPLRYYDPNGEFAFLLPLLAWSAKLLIPVLSTVITHAVGGAIAGVALYEGYKFVQAHTCNEESHSSNSTHNPSMQKKKKEGVTDPFNDSNLQGVSYPEDKKEGCHRLLHKKTNELIEYDH